MLITSIGKEEFLRLSKRQQTNLLIKERVRQNFNEKHFYYHIKNGNSPVERYLTFRVFLEKVIEKVSKRLVK